MANLYVDYSVRCTLGGTFEPFDEIASEDEAVSAAFARLREEITELVLRGGNEAWAATFQICLDRVEAEEDF